MKRRKSRGVNQKKTLVVRLTKWIEDGIEFSIQSLKDIAMEIVAVKSIAGEEWKTPTVEYIGKVIWENGDASTINEATHACADLGMLTEIAQHFELPVKRQFLTRAEEWKWTINPL